MKKFKPTWLYEKQHNITGLKYFGKTIKDPERYHGSGMYWTRHLAKHGTDVTTVWKKLFTNESKLTQYALNYSKQMNIVESTEYANLIPENGKTGGDTGLTEAGRETIRINSKQKQHSDETKQKIRNARAEQSSPMLGKKHNKETITKIKEARANQVITDETKKKISKANIGRIHSAERNQKISESKKGIKFSENHRKKLSMAAKLRHALKGEV